ncbi:MAG: hypothetical protein LBH28_02020, partial [Oscillospiraceae bacterium]|nr:hypothetical protein [Oscillospiraceae bacterium]
DIDTDFDAGFDTSFDAGFETDFDAGFDTSFDAGIDAGFDVDADVDVDFNTDFHADFGAGVEADVGADGAHGVGAGTHALGHHHDGLKIVTVRGIVAFFSFVGWAGLAALTSGVPTIWSIQISLLSGVAAMLLASAVIKFALKMQSSGNIDLKNALSQTADVYITIPPMRSNTGRVTMLLQDRFVELEAVTDSETAIKPNTKVEVIGLAGSDCVVVR